jgi:hydrogenase expression/formation protein HypC
MCLGVPGRVLSVDEGAKTAVVDFFGIRREVCLEIVDEPVGPGDYILNHVGFAIRRIPASEAEDTLALYAELLAREAPGDLMAADVRGELAAAGRSKG